MTTPEGEVTLASFNLNDDYFYWEVRIGSLLSQGGTQYAVRIRIRIRIRYDEAIYNGLSREELSRLESVSSNSGFAYQCLPDACPHYGVALLDSRTVAIESRADLINFFDVIDTPAELHWWMFANDYSLKRYDFAEHGFNAIVAWDDACGTRGEDLIKVFENGDIEKVKELSREGYLGCA